MQARLIRRILSVILVRLVTTPLICSSSGHCCGQRRFSTTSRPLPPSINEPDLNVSRTPPRYWFGVYSISSHPIFCSLPKHLARGWSYVPLPTRCSPVRENGLSYQDDLINARHIYVVSNDQARVLGCYS
jgi:hypothetical protein